MNNNKRKLIRRHKLVSDTINHTDSKVFTFLLTKAHYSQLEALSIRAGVTPDCLLRCQIKALLNAHNDIDTDTLNFQNHIDEVKRSAQKV